MEQQERLNWLETRRSGIGGSDAAKVMGKVQDKVYMPIEENSKVYDKLFDEYFLNNLN